MTTFYHGTRAGFSVGGWLVPYADHRSGSARPGHQGEHSTTFTYFTTDRELAEWYALNSRGRGKPKVLTVVPSARIEHDPSPYDDEREDQYRSKGWAKVVGVYFVS
jgi:hypothetical protein